MRILVTGGLGYIGSHTCIDLLAKDFELAIIDNLSNSTKNVLNSLKKLSGKQIQFFQNDITDRDKIKSICKDFSPDCIIHFAGLKSVSESISKPDEYYMINVKGTENILDAMSASGCKKIIFSSSAVVYGKPKYNPCDENHPTSPLNPYGKTKLIAENLIKDWINITQNSRGLIFRYFNPIGAHSSGLIGESPLGNANNIMPIILDVATGKKNYLTIFGNDYKTRDGTGIRDYIHVCDLSRAHTKGLQEIDNLEPFTILNLGTGKNFTIFELIKTFEKTTGLKVKTTISSRRPGDLGEVWASNEKAKNLLNLNLSTSLSRMCEDALKFKRKNS